MPTEVNEQMQDVIRAATMPADTAEAIDAGGAAPPIITITETNDAATESTVAHTETAEAEAAQVNTDNIRLADGEPEPLKVEPVAVPAPSWMRELEIEGLAAVQHVYDFGKGLGAEVITFVRSGVKRVTPVKFKGVEINNFDYQGDSHVHANEESANAHLSYLKENA